MIGAKPTFPFFDKIFLFSKKKKWKKGKNIYNIREILIVSNNRGGIVFDILSRLKKKKKKEKGKFIHENWTKTRGDIKKKKKKKKEINAKNV